MLLKQLERLFAYSKLPNQISVKILVCLSFGNQYLAINQSWSLVKPSQLTRSKQGRRIWKVHGFCHPKKLFSPGGSGYLRGHSSQDIAHQQRSTGQACTRHARSGACVPAECLIGINIHHLAKAGKRPQDELFCIAVRDHQLWCEPEVTRACLHQQATTGQRCFAGRRRSSSCGQIDYCIMYVWRWRFLGYDCGGRDGRSDVSSRGSWTRHLLLPWSESWLGTSFFLPMCAIRNEVTVRFCRHLFSFNIFLPFLFYGVLHDQESSRGV